MNITAVKENIEQMKEIIRELNVFTNQNDNINKLESRSKVSINKEEKKLLCEVIESLFNQLIILNNSIPQLVEGAGFYKQLKDGKKAPEKVREKLIQIQYNPLETREKVSLTITDKDKKQFLDNLSKSNLSIYKLKKKFAAKSDDFEFAKPNYYAKLSNHFFRDTSNNLIKKGAFSNLNKDLRKMNSPFVLSTYISMIFFTALITFFLSLLLLGVLLFYNLSPELPFLVNPDPNDAIILRFFKFIWIVVFLPPIIGLLMYIYPGSEAKNLGSRINQELPFVTIHMSAIASSGVEPLSIFKIILRTEDYKYTNIEFRKLMNLINFHGKDFVSALKETSRTSPSDKLKNLLDGLATTITSGGNLHDFLDKHSESYLFDYKLERERYTKASETFMNIYISIVIAAPMIFLMLFVIMGSTGSMIGYLGMSVEMLSFLIIFGIAFLNVLFLLFLHLKQPKM